MHPISIVREEMMVSGQVKFNITIHTALLTFAASLGTFQSTCHAIFNIGLIGTMTKVTPKLTTGVKKIKSLEVEEVEECSKI
jgi:hypothetical protein